MTDTSLADVRFCQHPESFIQEAKAFKVKFYCGNRATLEYDLVCGHETFYYCEEHRLTLDPDTEIECSAPMADDEVGCGLSGRYADVVSETDLVL